MNSSLKLAAAAAAGILTLSACTNSSGETAEAPVTVTVSAPAAPATPPSDSPAPSTVTGTPPSSESRQTPTVPPAQPPQRPKSALEMTPREAMDAVMNGDITMAEYCTRDTFLTSGDTQMCYYYNNPEELWPADYAELPWQDSPTRFTYTHDQAYAAWQQGTPYYIAFCLNYEPVTPGGVSQCEGIQAGTVDGYTGEYIGP